MRINRLSASSYDTYDHCQWKYFLTYQLGFEDVSGPAALLGTIVHNVLEEITKNHNDESISDEDKNIITMELWKKHFNICGQEEPSVIDTIKNDKIKKVLGGLFKLINGPYTPFTSKSVAAEQRFDLQIKEKRFLVGDDQYLAIRGVIDRIDKHDDSTIEIVDYKTGLRQKFMGGTNKKQEASDLYRAIQPSLYFMAAHELYPQYKNIIATFIYITDGGPISVPFSKNDIPRIKKQIQDRLVEIKSNENPQKRVGWWCKRLCHYGKTGTCRNVWNEKQKNGLDFVDLKYSVLNKKD